MKIDFSPKRLLLTLLFVLFVLYCLFQARFLILGPQVWITAPLDGEVVASSVITISGTTSNIAHISLNGRQIFTDEGGAWSEKLIVSPGTSIMTVVVRDRFGRERKRSVRVILESNE